VPKDDEQAYFWWLLVSSRGDASSVKNRDLVESSLTAEQRATAQAPARARNWKPTPAGQGAQPPLIEGSRKRSP
jgi:hypothetical protein